MFGVISGIVLLAGSVGLMAAAVLHNQLDPNYATAMTIPLANIISLITALLSAVVSALASRGGRARAAAKRTMMTGFACAVVLALLLPLSNGGHLSSVQ
ncbi:hypothetical protein HBA54_10325 [Pelagibius litoralis]|uniref:Uncharacterized protein n=1 Tax=Pelagibius litoralis TaxID=374515 RepID=A0A967EW17_9PROT|nr:hypothetical protein [Pelagibius litoralis]NIA68989.1 hypothetical protein [Pelagibius litoralis]